MALYSFDHFDINGTTYTSPTVNLTVTSDLAITAYYVLVVPQRTITYSSTPIAVPITINGSTVQSGQNVTVDEGTPITIVAPNEVTV